MKLLKGILTGAVSIGVSQVVTNIVEVTKPKNLSTVKKITSEVGGLAISAVISGLSTEYIERQIDAAVDIIKKVKKENDPDEGRETSDQ